jgi:hypothetical protein
VTDLNALADRLDMYAGWSAGRTAINDQRTAARILRAVAAAPGPLREWARRVRYLETENADLRARLHDTRVALAETHSVCREQAAEIARLQAVERSAFIADL